ncbi:UNKNOWN [Stylonychia lemnae]|uniref:Uncharacterized protein n=1 Tax=Stylonychia lemnae TaxID=5949 RepID=A0A078A4M6_STYLE|nr:UNKNOWN [Stylonychia lemnae]|eukprot:CDW77220.1 UNKNOWN [Stylonychia lemnae]
MLNHTFLRALRPVLFSAPQSQELASRKVYYETVKAHRTKYKSSAKEKRKAKKRAQIGGIPTPRDFGEDQPSFFTSPRTRLYVKLIQDYKNANRINRKPIPEEVKQELAKKSKEFFAYKHVERILLEKEANEFVISQYKAQQATIFLPDQLFEESFGDSGETRQLEMHEFMPAQLYLEQVLRIFPREYASRFRLSPAFEETLMKYEESKGGSAGTRAVGSGSGVQGGMPAL